MSLTNRDVAIYRISSIVESSRETVDAFAKKIGGADPFYEFEWADDAFKAAALLRVSSKAAALVGAGRSLKEMADEFRRELNHAARYSSSRPTSECTNVAARCRLEALAELLEVLEEGLDD